MTTIKSELQKDFKGDVDDSEETLRRFSHDASLFEQRPVLVVFPKDSNDVKTLVKFVSSNKDTYPNLSITARSAGTDMSGGAIGTGIIIDFTRYMNKIINISSEEVIVMPGCFYRDMERETLKIERIMPAYTASKEINAVGGMVANNSGGEKAIKYGKTENFINRLKVVFSDGNEYEIKPLTKGELEDKISKDDFESHIYKNIYELIQNNLEEINSARPDVSKNSAGYYLWNVWKNGNFDLCQLICGSQGTLGLVTEITFKIIPTEPFSNLLAVFMPDIKNLGNIVKEIIPFKPDSLETYDDYSMKLAVKFFFDFFKSLGFWGALKLGLKFIPEAWMILSGGVPKLILLVEVAGKSESEVKTKLSSIEEKIKHFGYKMHIAKDKTESEKYWRIRRESFNMLRKHIHGKRTAPFIDDVIVKPEFLPEFLPRIEKEIDDYKLIYTIAGHAGNGNFHIIPLMDIASPYSVDMIINLSKKIYSIVKEFNGSITAEHNDGIIRTPFLEEMYGNKIVSLFKNTKSIFDPKNIFNPGKKVGGTFDDIRNSIRKSS